MLELRPACEHCKVPLPHRHERYDQIIYGLESVVTFTVNGQSSDISLGQSCFIPCGAPRQQHEAPTAEIECPDLPFLPHGDILIVIFPHFGNLRP